MHAMPTEAADVAEGDADAAVCPQPSKATAPGGMAVGDTSILWAQWPAAAPVR